MIGGDRSEGAGCCISQAENLKSWRAFKSGTYSVGRSLALTEFNEADTMCIAFGVSTAKRGVKISLRLTATKEHSPMYFNC